MDQTAFDDGRIARMMIPTIERDLETERCSLVLGPYEVGKSYVASAIARRFGPDAIVLDGTNPCHRPALTSTLLRGSRGKLIVIDEIHEVPEVVDHIRLELEASFRDHVPIGKFLLLSSRPLEAARIVFARFGTRVSHHTLLPIGLPDLVPSSTLTSFQAAAAISSGLDTTQPIDSPDESVLQDMLWLRGGFPRSLLAANDSASYSWRGRYIDSLCNRGFSDGRQTLFPSTIRELLDTIAANQGEEKPIEGAAQKACVAHLRDLGLIRALHPWCANENKRQKHMKTYIRDTGLLHWLQRHRSLDDLRRNAKAYGHSWETFCVEHLIAAAPGAKPHYYRDDDKNEIDLILEFSTNNRIGVEEKSPGGNPKRGFYVALQALAPIDGFIVQPIPKVSASAHIQLSRYPICSISSAALRTS